MRTYGVQRSESSLQAVMTGIRQAIACTLNFLYSDLLDSELLDSDLLDSELLDSNFLTLNSTIGD